jgi:hypothetical protein
MVMIFAISKKVLNATNLTPGDLSKASLYPLKESSPSSKNSPTNQKPSPSQILTVLPRSNKLNSENRFDTIDLRQISLKLLIRINR